jgi:CheY-like chemotaxis protein
VVSKQVLIVDDEAHIRLLIERLLEDLEDDDVLILTAANGDDGLKMIRAQRPDLVFLDVMMPGINGFEVCRTVKKELAMEDVYIVLLTAKGQKQDAQLGVEAGADMYMTKPFSPDALLDLTEKVLGL